MEILNVFSTANVFSDPTAIDDIYFTATIGIIILIGMAIVGICICKCVDICKQTKLEELKLMQEHELIKMTKENAFKKAAAEFNAEQTDKQRRWQLEIEEKKLRHKEIELMQANPEEDQDESQPLNPES